MSRTIAFDKLVSCYPEMIRSMQEHFDSHDFILKLAQRQQKWYVLALQEYAEGGKPFMILHGLLAQELSNFPELVAKVGVQNSADIFGEVNSATLWRKVGK